MSRIESDQNSTGISSGSCETEHSCFPTAFSWFLPTIQLFRPNYVMEQFRTARKALVESHLLSIWLLLLAMPTLALLIQCGLFLFGKTCSPFPFWFSFLAFSILALILHWKCLVKFWGLVFLAFFFTSFTFSYLVFDAEVYHIPMQLLLREGWNPVFDSSIEKFSNIVDCSTLNFYHTLFLPKTVALCGALVARSTGLWIANSFLGYILLFVLFRTAFSFAKQQWNCHWISCLLFALTVSLNSKLTVLLEGLVDYNVYSAFMITVFALGLYWQYRHIHDLVLAVIATAICGTTKTTGLVNCCFLWLLFGVCFWKHKETYLGILAVTFLIAWIGMSPLITSWVQYGSPFYPTMTFDQKITIVDITDDFRSNADGARMGYLARFVYAWISPALASKACALYYQQENFHPLFFVNHGVRGLGSLNPLFCFSILLIMIAKKNMVTFSYCFIFITLFLCPLKFFGFSRYFPQAWALIPIGFYHFAYNPPIWLQKNSRIRSLLRYSLLSLVCILCCSSVMNISAFQIRCMILEGLRQELLKTFHENGTVVVLPNNSIRNYMLSKRLHSADIDYEFSQQAIDWDHIEEDTLFPQIKKYYLEFWRSDQEYPVCNTPSGIINFKWLDVFKHFPHPLFYRKPDITESSIPNNETMENQEQIL